MSPAVAFRRRGLLRCVPRERQWMCVLPERRPKAGVEGPDRPGTAAARVPTSPRPLAPARTVESARAPPGADGACATLTQMDEDVLEFGQFRFVPKARELTRAGVPVELPRRSFECLEYLVRHRDRAVHRDELVEAVFRRPNVSDAQLGQVVLRTRRALDDDGALQRVIRTVPGHGYRWVAPVDVVAADAAPAAAPQPREV